MKERIGMKRNFLPTTRAGKLSVGSFVICLIATILSAYIEDTVLGDLGFLLCVIGLIAGIRAICAYKERSVLVFIFVILSAIPFVGYAILLLWFLLVIELGYGSATFIVAFGVVVALVSLAAKLIKGRK